MTFLCKSLQLPRVPLDIINQIDLNYRPTASESFAYIQRYVTNWKNSDAQAAINQRIENPEFANWAKPNISDKFIFSGTNYVLIDQPTPRTTGAHTDATRDYALMYTVQSGGDQAELCYWKQKNEKLIRPRKTYVSDFNDLDLIHRIKLPLYEWMLVRTDVLHSVENLCSTRIQLQLSFKNRSAIKHLL